MRRIAGAIEETTMTDRDFKRANNASRERLADLAQTLTPTQMAIDLGGGWTVASALAHVGFWDRWQAARWQEMLAGRWSADDASLIAAEHLANEALDPYWAGIVAADLPALALEAATRLDALAAQAPNDLVDALDGGPSAYLLHRHNHRNDHLDQIRRGLDAAAESGSGPAGRSFIEKNAASRQRLAALPAPPTDRSYLQRDEASLARLTELAGRLTREDLALGVGDGAWTVAQVLGHLAFWDRFLAARWRAALASGPGEQPTYLPDELPGLLNEALAPVWAALAADAAGAAVRETLAAAQAIDAIIAGLPAETPVESILAERPALLDRSIHRLEHLAAINLARAAGGR
jgi:hypothetical protein